MPPETTAASMAASLSPLQSPGVASLISGTLQPSPTPQLPESLLDLDRRLEIIKTQFGALDDLLKSTTPKNVAATIIALELALTKVYKLAVFIRGDYDGSDIDEELQKSILSQATEAFRNCHNAAELGFKEIGDIHVQVTALQSNKIGPLRTELEVAQQQLVSEKRNLSQQMEQNKRNLAVWQKQCKEAVEQYDRAHREQADLGNQIALGWSVLTKILSNDEAGAAASIMEAHVKLRSAAELKYKGELALISNQEKSHELNVKQANLDSMERGLPLLQSLVNTINNQASQLMTGFASLKDNSRKLLLLAQEIENRAVVTMKMAYKKSMFALGLLKLCRIALVDQRVSNEIRMIRDEISEGYAGLERPDEVQKLLGEVKSLLEGNRNAIQ